LRVALALTIGPPPAREEDLTDELLEACWYAHKDRSMERWPEDPPWAYWRFEPNVPPELREQRDDGRPGVAG
jgi:hypothetical protein